MIHQGDAGETDRGCHCAVTREAPVCYRGPCAGRNAQSKTKVARSVAAQAASKITAGRGKAAAAAVPAAAPTRVPPLSKGELRALIEKLEAANIALKAKGREANRTAKVAARRIAELEEEVAQLQAEAAQPTAPPGSAVAERRSSGAAGRPGAAKHRPG